MPGAALIGLTAVLDEAAPGDRIFVVSFGSGAGSDAFSLTATGRLAGRQAAAPRTKDYIARRKEIDYGVYVRYRGKLHADPSPSPGGLHMEIARHWRLRKQRYSLMGEQCDHCRQAIFPPRDVCPHCGKEARARSHGICGKGEVYSFTVVHDPPTGYENQAPYAIAVVKLEEGPMVTAQLTDVDSAEVSIGMPVEMVTRRLRTEGDEGLIHYGYKFRPLLAVS